MTDIKLKVVDEPSKDFITDPSADAVLIRGKSGTVNYLCGNCGARLVENIEPGQLQDLDLECRACGACSHIP